MNDEALRQIADFTERRRRQGANPRRADDQGLALRSLVRRSIGRLGPGTPLELSQDAISAADILREPGDVSRRYVATWWGALQSFIRLMVGPPEEAERRVQAIHALLIPNPSLEWHTVNRTVGGRPRTGRPRHLLSAIDLLAIMTKAADGELALRDRILVGLLCWSPLRPGEAVSLRWQDFVYERDPEGKLFPLWAKCQRRGTTLCLPIHKHAGRASSRSSKS